MTLCENGDGRPARRGKYCWGCARARSREQRRTNPSQLAPIDRLRKSATEFGDVDSEDDVAWDHADDNLRKAATAYGRRGHAEAIREGLARARANGIRLGRPGVLQGQQVAKLVKQRGVRGAARVLGVTHYAVLRLLRGGGAKT